MPSYPKLFDVYATHLHAVHMWIDQDTDTLLRNYKLGFDRSMYLLYITAEIHSDCLDKGTDPTRGGISYAITNGTLPGDQPCKIIGTSLGGCGNSRNMFPWNPKIDRSEWESGEQQVYNFLKSGNNRHALFLCAIEYEDRQDTEGEALYPTRPARIHYHYKLYKNNKATGQVIDGMLDNLNPIVTSPELFRRA